MTLQLRTRSSSPPIASRQARFRSSLRGYSQLLGAIIHALGPLLPDAFTFAPKFYASPAQVAVYRDSAAPILLKSSLTGPHQCTGSPNTKSSRRLTPRQWPPFPSPAI